MDGKHSARLPYLAVSWMLPVLLFVLLALPSGLRGVVSLRHGNAPAWEAWINMMPLSGITVREAHPKLNLHNWLTGDFQDKYGRWFGQNFALRSLMVRIDNQIGYTVFQKSNTPNSSLVVGKNKMLFENIYLYEYCDLNPKASDAQLEALASDLADVGDRLRARGVGFVVYLSPSKAAVYPENIPPIYLSQKTGQPRGHDRFIPIMQQHHVVYADGHQAVLDAKAGGTTLPLFCRGGTHYSDMGVFYAMQPLLSALEKEGHRPIPPLNCSFPVPVDFHPTGTDDDLANLLNVYYPPTYYPSPHPNLTFDWTNAKPGGAGKLSWIGGSFSWQPLHLFEKNHVYTQMDFYYYYHTDLFRYPGEIKTPPRLVGSDWSRAFLHSTVIVLEINEQRLYDSGDTHYLAFLRDAKHYLPPVKKTPL